MGVSSRRSAETDLAPTLGSGSPGLLAHVPLPFPPSLAGGCGPGCWLEFCLNNFVLKDSFLQLGRGANTEQRNHPPFPSSKCDFRKK